MIGIGARLATLFAGNGLVVGLVVALGVMVLTWDRGRINAAVNRGVEKERNRVEVQGRETAAKASNAKKSATSNPDRSLTKWFRD